MKKMLTLLRQCLKNCIAIDIAQTVRAMWILKITKKSLKIIEELLKIIENHSKTTVLNSQEIIENY